ncbi:MAG: diaminopimelate decarboxylase [Candidatus Helarchaeota archaeon]
MELTEFLKRKNLSAKGNELLIGGVSTVDLAKKYETPLYVINEETIKQRIEALKKAFTPYYENIRIHYAVKANSNLQVLKIMNRIGISLDVVSPGEIFLAQKAGFSPDRILYTGNNYSQDDLIYAVKTGVMINLDAPSQLNRLVRLLDTVEGANPNLLICYRVNPEFGGGHHMHAITAGPDVKFGIFEDDIIDAYKNAKDAGFAKFGIHMHIGSGILDLETFEIASTKFLEIIELIATRLGITFEFVDFGGGIGIPYRPTEKPLDLDAYAKNYSTKLKELSEKLGWNPPILAIEPGRFLVAEACVLLSTVTTIKPVKDKVWVGIDTGLNALIRPAMYGSYHHILAANKMDEKETREYQIGGPICESGDVFTRDQKLPTLEEDDLLAILDAGAYGFTMASHYNARLRPAEVLIRQGKPILVRERETLEDLLKHQIIDI